MIKVKCFLNCEQIPPILSQNEFVWEKFEDSLISSWDQSLAKDKKPVLNFYLI